MTEQIIARNRWFFVKMTGRRRIGKTTLIQHAIQGAGGKPVFYVQIPDSAPAGVLSAVADALESFGIPTDLFRRPATLAEFARLVGLMARAGHIVVLDEFQYFHRSHLAPFCSSLQAEVDALSAQAEHVPGGLVVLGSMNCADAMTSCSNSLHDTEIDLVALNETDKVIRLGSCKRSADRLAADVAVFDGHIQRFLEQFPKFSTWRIERASIAPSIPVEVRTHLEAQGRLVEDLSDLTAGL